MIAQVNLTYYLPRDIQYDSSIPTPESVLGFEVGEWHVRHDQMVRYLNTLAEVSDRITIDTIGFTHEKRPLLHLTITAPENHTRIEEIRTEHIKLTNPDLSEELNIDDMPAVAWLGFSIHGNEASGGNAALLAAYHLAAAQGEVIDELLRETVVLLDPCYNPDGFNRFASWVNTHRGINLISPDPSSREHNEAWPRGRTNHYWFDLNRDWLLVQHPESQARIKQFHRWKPNLLTDHHEMGTNSTFFFQPGIPSRNHPLTPQATYDLTDRLAEYHAAALDKIGSLYYSKESFDDYYYGKGSTYPDVNGAVGILFEQASSRGHIQRSVNGELTFPFTIRNQFRTALSSMKGVHEMRKDFLAMQREFYLSAKREAEKDPTKAYLIDMGNDPGRTMALAKLLDQHKIAVFEPKNDLSIDGHLFSAGISLVVPALQPQYRLIKAVFERRTTFKDSLFYDVSSWTLPLAFNLKDASLNQSQFNSTGLGGRLTSFRTMGEGPAFTSYAYALQWGHYDAPKALNQLLQRGIRVKVARKAFSDKSGHHFPMGTILIPVQNQNISSERLHESLVDMVETDGISVVALQSGHTTGVNLGSNLFGNITAPRVLLVVGDGVNSYEAGEVWHLFDQRVMLNASLVSTRNMNRIDLSDYNTIVMVNGSYNELNGAAQNLKTWVSAGGTIVATKSAIRWLANRGIGQAEWKSRPTTDREQDQLPFAGRSNRRGAQVIGGAIVEAQLDMTHPLCFGYTRDKISLFRNSTLFLKPQTAPYRNPILYTKKPLLSGYISTPNQEALAETAAASISVMGKGRVVALVDNPNFRAFWYGTNRLFLNGIFFREIMN
ncbi:MAG: M14 family metallopeptidase [Bacteroidota bacterium]